MRTPQTEPSSEISSGTGFPLGYLRANKLSTDKCDISYATVNTNASHIDKKLQVDAVASAVKMALREGLA